MTSIIRIYTNSFFTLLKSSFFNAIHSGSGVNYQEFLGKPISLSNFWESIIIAPPNLFSAAIGIVASILLLFGLLSLRKKIVIFSLLLAIFSIFLAAGNFIAKFFYTLPGFGQMRHIERALVMFVFASPLIIAYGFNNLVDSLKKYSRHLKEGRVFLIVIALLMIELVFLQSAPPLADVINPKDIPILEEISKDSSDFRIVSHTLVTPIGPSGYNYYTQLGIPSVKGGGGIWMNDYVQYLAIAQQAAPSRMFGILNSKYILSDKEIDGQELLLKGKFLDCKGCLREASGPYLYENLNSIPRAFVVPNSVLIAGNEKEEFAYRIIIENINPLSGVLIEDRNSLDRYSEDELARFSNIILLSGSVTQNEIPKLQRYVSQGGNILPDLLEGEVSISGESFEGLFNSTSSQKELQVNDISVNEFTIDLDGEHGWLVLSERVAHFPGWKASINGNDLKIYKANRMISAVYLDGKKGELKFKYYPDSFRKGRAITIITSSILLISLIYMIYSRRKKWQK